MSKWMLINGIILKKKSTWCKPLTRCVRLYFEVDYNNSLPPYVWQSVCLPMLCPVPQYPLTPETCPTFRPTSPHFPPSTSFILFRNPPASWEVCIWVRDVLWMESSPDSGQTPQLPSIFRTHPLEELFLMWLFLTPCAISLLDLSPIFESVWLARQFHRIAHAKRDPREGEPDSLLLYSFCL